MFQLRRSEDQMLWNRSDLCTVLPQWPGLPVSRYEARKASKVKHPPVVDGVTSKSDARSFDTSINAR